MAGHSHWKSIKHKKGATDAKRGKVFSKLAKHIISAAKHGGGDPTKNLRLSYAIEKAKEYLLPRDTIERAIQRGTGELGGESIEEILYEGYGPGGVALLIEIMTDNKMRTAPEMRKLLETHGGSLGAAGCVAWNFDKRGVLTVAKEAAPEDTVMEQALEAGALDLKTEGDSYQVITDPTAFLTVREKLAAARIPCVASEVLYLPKTTVKADAQLSARIIALIEELEEQDDVQAVHTNCDFDEAAMAQAGA